MAFRVLIIAVFAVLCVYLLTVAKKRHLIIALKVLATLASVIGIAYLIATLTYNTAQGSIL